MENIDLEIKILDYLQNRLSDAERKEVEQLRKTSPDFDAIFNEVEQVWSGLDLRKVPPTSMELKSNFNAILKTFEMEQEHSKASSLTMLWSKLAGLFVYKPKYNWAYSLLLISFGALGAYLFLRPKSDTKELELSNSKQIMMLQMLENPTAVERMKAVSYTQDLQKVDDKVIDALLTTLNTDPNENVRLVTLDALTQLAGNPKVREGLVSSIIKQDSEMMQAAMADAMLHLQEKRSVKPLKRLLEDQNMMNDIIKKKLEQTVKKLETI